MKSMNQIKRTIMLGVTSYGSLKDFSFGMIMNGNL